RPAGDASSRAHPPSRDPPRGADRGTVARLFERHVKAAAGASTVHGMRSRATSLAVLVCLWLGLGYSLSLITRRVADWFVMTDELLYERLAISIARTHSLWPRVHTEVISNLNQLYPVLIAPVFRHGAVLHGFHEAHTLNAFVMT